MTKFTLTRADVLKQAAIISLGQSTKLTPDIPIPVLGSLLTVGAAARLTENDKTAKMALEAMMLSLTMILTLNGDKDAERITTDEYFAAVRAVAGSNDETDEQARKVFAEVETANAVEASAKSSFIAPTVGNA